MRLRSTTLGCTLNIRAIAERRLSTFESLSQFEIVTSIGRVLFILASEFYRQSNLLAAVELFREVLEVDPAAAVLHHNLGVVLVARPAEARSEFETALRLDPELARARARVEAMD